jgi:nitroreductase
LEFVDVVSSRKSVRDFLDKEVKEEKLTKILGGGEAGAFVG